MPTEPFSGEVSLNDRFAALVTVLADGHLSVLNRDPFAAALPLGAPSAHPIIVQYFPCKTADTAVVEMSMIIEANVSAQAAIDAWAVRKSAELFNVYVVREETGSDQRGSVLKAQSSLIATDLSLQALGLAVEFLARSGAGLSAEYVDRFAVPAAPSLTDGPEEATTQRSSVSQLRVPTRPVARQEVDRASAMPGYL